MAVIGGIAISGCNHSGSDESTSPAPLPQNNNAPAPMAPVPPNGTPDTGAATTQTTTTESTTPSTPSTTTTTTSQTSTTSTPPAVKPATNYPMGIVIPGKKGFCKSPYAEFAEPVDIRGYAPGTAVRCPYTNKIFIVPQN